MNMEICQVVTVVCVLISLVLCVLILIKLNKKKNNTTLRLKDYEPDFCWKEPGRHNRTSPQVDVGGSCYDSNGAQGVCLSDGRSFSGKSCATDKTTCNMLGGGELCNDL